jgi:imidazolonepropionase
VPQPTEVRWRSAGRSGEDTEGRRAVGSLAVGHRADLQLLNAPSATHLAYRPGVPLTDAVWRGGAKVR